MTGILFKIRFLKRCPEGSYLPTGYRFAYPEWPRRAAICAPIGLHLVVMLLRRAWEWSYWRPGASARDSELADAHSLGRQEAEADRQDAIRVAYDEGLATGIRRERARWKADIVKELTAAMVEDKP